MKSIACIVSAGLALVLAAGSAGGGRGFDLPHRLTAVDFLATIGTLVEAEILDRIGLSLARPLPLPTNLPDVLATARRTRCDLYHCHYCLEASLR